MRSMMRTIHVRGAAPEKSGMALDSIIVKQKT
jgi:hypothetical protein